MCLAPARKGKGRGCPRQSENSRGAKQAAAQKTPRPIGHASASSCGIGASAGGLEAFKTFFTHMPADAGMAFVLVQHLDPHHKSMLVDLLGRTPPCPWRKPRTAKGRCESRLCHSAGCYADDRGRRSARDEAGAVARASPADRHLLCLACRGPGGARGLHRPFGRRQRRHGRPAGDQGGWRPHIGAGRSRSTWP